LFQKDGVAYTCNPNTNEATPIENSSGVGFDDEGKDAPNCNEGYEVTSTMVVAGSSGTGYTSWGCSKSSVPDNGGGGDNGNPTFETPTTSTSQDGSTTWTWSDGTKQTLSSNGTLTTYYPDGSSSVKQVGNDYTPSSSGGGSGTSTGGGGNGTNGNTANENTDNTNTDTPTDNTPVSNSCNDSSLTLQEKMLCEMNAGVKKLNSESSPENSLNNLLKELNKDNNTNATAINTNLKDSKALQENQLNETKKATEYLHSLENAQDGSNLLLEAANTKLEQIRDNLQDEEGKSYLSKISDFIDTLTTPTSDEDKNSYQSQINDKVSNTLNNVFSKYSNVLGFGSTYGNRPENITLTLFNHQYTLIDFSIFDSYVSIIRSLFLTLAYLYGFMNLIRSSN